MALLMTVSSSRPTALPASRGPKPGANGAEPTAKRGGRNKKAKKARMKKHESSDSTASHRTPPYRPPLQGLNQTSWSPSDTSQSTFPIPYPAVMPAYPLPVYPGSGPVPPRAGAGLPGFGDGQGGQAPSFTTPLVTPMVAFVLPNYMFPQMGGAPRQPFYPEQASFPPQTAFPPQPSYPVPAQFAPQAPFPAEPFPETLPEARGGLSRSSTPVSAGARDRTSPPLFESRCSSPLQLNLLQLEETPRSVERQDSSAPPPGALGNGTGEKAGAGGATKPGEELQQVGAATETDRDRARCLSHPVPANLRVYGVPSLLGPQPSHPADQIFLV